ncbi:MAG: cytochrome c [Bacteroidota bacterium]
MYNSLPLEPYSQTVYSTNTGGNFSALPEGLDTVKYFTGPGFDSKTSAQTAPTGTIPRQESWYRGEAYVPYDLPNTFEGYEASALIQSPLFDPAVNDDGLNCTEATFQRGKETYEVMCIVCHGPNGKGKGSLVTGGAYPAVPAYNSPALKELPAGKMFHTLTYGKNNMGSYASQLSPQQRWEVVCYIQKFQEQE